MKIWEMYEFIKKLGLKGQKLSKFVSIRWQKGQNKIALVMNSQSNVYITVSSGLAEEHTVEA